MPVLTFSFFVTFHWFWNGLGIGAIGRRNSKGILGGRMYLAAYGQGFGATGLTFFDNDVSEFFSPHAAGKSVMFLIALGYAARR